MRMCGNIIFYLLTIVNHGGCSTVLVVKKSLCFGNNFDNIKDKLAGLLA